MVHRAVSKAISKGEKASTGELIAALKNLEPESEFRDFFCDLIRAREEPIIAKLESKYQPGDSDAALEIGLRFRAFEDFQNSQKWLERAAEAGNLDAIQALGSLMALKGDLGWLKRGSEMKDRGSIELLLEHLLASKWDTEKRKEALRWFPIALECRAAKFEEYVRLLLEVGTRDQLLDFAENLPDELPELSESELKWLDDDELIEGDALTKTSFAWEVIQRGSIKQIDVGIQLLYPLIRAKDALTFWNLGVELKKRGLIRESKVWFAKARPLIRKLEN